MEEIKTDTNMEEFITNNRANYYSGITSITVNGKAAYELKGKFLDDLRDNSFSGTNGEDAIKNIEYFLKIVDAIDLPNVNHKRLRLAIFPISLVGNASKWSDEFKGLITTWVDLTHKFFRKYYQPSRSCKVIGTNADMEYDPFDVGFGEWIASTFYNHKTMDQYTKNALWLYWTRGDAEVELTDEKFFDPNDKNSIDKEEVAEIFRIKTNIFDFETPLCKAFDEFNYLVKSENGVPYEICDHICEPFHFKNGDAKWPTRSSNEDGFCNGEELPGMVRVGYMTYFQDYEWYVNLMDISLKEEALKQKTIYEKSWGDATQSVINFYAWLKRSFKNFHELNYELLVKLQEYWWKINDHECSLFTNWRDHIRGPYANINTTYDTYLDSRNGRACNDSDVQEDEEQHEEGRCDLFNDPAREPPVCMIRIIEMIKYSFGQEEEYVVVKAFEYDDLTNKDACQAYQKIFHIMNEGWLVTRAW
ncbi:hypothetical protein Tco_0503359 [Tanacetum coccineum]